MSTVYEIITDRIIDSLSHGVVPWRKPWRSEKPKNLISKKDYRGVNVLLLHAAPFESPHWLTFNQAKGLGGSVKKGERGTPVVFWKITEDKKRRDKRGNPEKSFLLRYYTVFNVAQCEGVKVPPPAPRPDLDPIQECERIVLGFGDRPEIENGGDLAAYSPSKDRIRMPPRSAFFSAPEYYSTLFHELIHSTGSEKRLARQGVVDRARYASHRYSFEELVAECGSAFLCGEAGISGTTLENSAAYIAHWVKALKNDPKMLVNASGQAAKAADLILGRTGEQVIEQLSTEAA
jgi:antirestriction protein ArdC